MEFDVIAALGNVQATWTTFVWGFFMVFALFYAFGLGLGRVVNTILGVYVSLAVVHAVPYFAQSVDISVANFITFKVATFVVIGMVAMFLFSQMAIGPTMKLDMIAGLPYTILFAVLASGMVLSAVLSLLPTDALLQLSHETRLVFTSDPAVAMWLVAPVVALFVLKKKLKKEDDED